MRNHTVLVIGGDEGDLAGYGPSLLAAGIAPVVPCPGGPEMKPVLAGADPALVILDLGPSPEAGETLLKDLRAGFPRVPVIVVAGTRDPATQDRCLAAGAAGYLFKPVPPVRLAAAAIWALAGENGEWVNG